VLEEVRVIEDHLGQLDQQMARLLAHHQEAVRRLAEVPGLGVDSAQQIIAEVGTTATTFPLPKHLASWMGARPGNEESAGVNSSGRCPKGNRLKQLQYFRHRTRSPVKEVHSMPTIIAEAVLIEAAGYVDLGRALLARAGAERIRRKPQASIGGVRSRGLGDRFVKAVFLLGRQRGYSGLPTVIHKDSAIVEGGIALERHRQALDSDR
jgi:hypothetical protein